MADQFIARAFRNTFMLHGPDLNLLGTREPEVYGVITFADINAALAERAAACGMTLVHSQSNHEGALVDRIHVVKSEGIEFIIINPAAYTHTSVALCDALTGVVIPYIEVHLSNVHRREPSRHHSYLADQAVGVICGLGWRGYLVALDLAIDQYGG